jgi:solute carrier family 25 iron transporter 28/37
MSDSLIEFSLEWEEREEEVPFGVHMVAGSIAGLTEHTLLLPLDNLKTHLQTKSASLRDAFAEIRSRGLLSFYRGSSIIALGCIPSHAVFFMNFEYMKRKVSNQNTEIDILGNMLVGSTATVFHDLMMTPCEMIKQRSQLLKNLPYWAIIKHSYAREGIKSFWRSFPVNFIGSIPNGTIFVTANENLKTLYRRHVSELTLSGHFLCASVSGMISAWVTSPLDNIKTRLNVQQVHIESIVKQHEAGVKEKTAGKWIGSTVGAGLGGGAWGSLRRAFQQDGSKVNQCKCRELPTDRKQSGLIKYPNAWCAAKIIRKEEGLKGFFKGATMRMGAQSLSSAISWSVYEYCKRMLINTSRK